MKKVELLAPAGSIEILKTAVHAGADAVYVGGPTFSARAGAKNFTYEELKEGIDYAHFFKRKVFVAVNTLVKNDEIRKLLTYMEELGKLSPDAVIIQDLGVASLFQEYLPELPIHASTQLTASNRYSIQALQEIGFKRVVVARELEIKEIGSIVSSHPDMQIEAFIHGAQCFCYSGQCLMSSIIGGRSGNRGQCAQPCRLPYQLDKIEGTLLSPKDLMGLPLLREMLQAGVHTLKIEGRLKNREYVYQTVKAYRAKIDQLQRDIKKDEYNIQSECNIEQISIGDNKGTTAVDAEPAESVHLKTFNREFSTGFLGGDLGKEFTSLTRHNSKGILIGKVADFNPKSQHISIQLERDLIVGDGIYIDLLGKDGIGFTVVDMTLDNKKIEEAKQGQTVTVGMNIMRTFDNRNNKIGITKDSAVYKSYDLQLSREIESEDQPTKVGISFHLIATINQQIVLQYRDSDGNSGEITYDYIVQEAQKHPISLETVEKQFNRLGNTLFTLQDLTLDSSPNGMVPASVLNELRRLAIDDCINKRINRESYQFRGSRESWNTNLYIPKKATNNRTIDEPYLTAKINEPEQLEGLSPFYQHIYYSGHADRIAEVIDKAGSRPVYAVLSSMVKEKELETINSTIKGLLKEGVTGFVVNQIGQRELILSIDSNVQIAYDVGMHVFNHKTYQLLENKDPVAIHLSLELNQFQLKEFKKLGHLYIHGRYRLMISEHSLLTAHGKNSLKPRQLVDRKGFAMPAMENELGQVEIYNAQVTSLLKDLATLKKHRHQGYIIDVSRDFLSINDSKKVLSLYAKAYKIVFEEDFEEVILTDKINILHDQVVDIYQGNITKGHWQRGVK